MLYGSMRVVVVVCVCVCVCKNGVVAMAKKADICF
jgi:hypothetical protein